MFGQVTEGVERYKMKIVVHRPAFGGIPRPAFAPPAVTEIHGGTIWTEIQTVSGGVFRFSPAPS
jgi:hypothetical protein